MTVRTTKTPAPKCEFDVPVHYRGRGFLNSTGGGRCRNTASQLVVTVATGDEQMVCRTHAGRIERENWHYSLGYMNYTVQGPLDDADAVRANAVLSKGS